MSIRVLTQVWDKAPYTEGTLLLLLALADWSNDEGVCWPKIDQMAHKARLSRSGVQFAMRRLLTDGAVSVVKETLGPGRARHYQLGAQYLSPSPKRGSVNEEKGLSKPSANKEEPSVNRQIQIQGMTEEQIKWAVEWNAKEKARGRV